MLFADGNDENTTAHLGYTVLLGAEQPRRRYHMEPQFVHSFHQFRNNTPPLEREQAIDLLFSRFQKPLMKFLADRFGDLDPDDRTSAVHDAFSVVHAKAQAGTLDMESLLLGLLFTVAQRKAIDLRRRASCRIRTDVELTEEVGDYLVGTETGRDWSLAVTLGKTTEVIAEFRQFVPSLKGQQRRVASVMADFLPDWLTDTEIADEVLIRTQQKITVM